MIVRSLYTSILFPMQSKRGEADASVSLAGLVLLCTDSSAILLCLLTAFASFFLSCSGVRLKTRKRNIVVPHDPQSFADAVVDVLADAKESDDINRTLEAANKVLDSAELDFNRYGGVLFEVAFSGARLASGGNVSADGKTLPFNILASAPDAASILPYIKWFQAMIRRRPFLVKSLENTLIQLILSLEFYTEEERKKIAIAMARCFALKVGVLPERVLPTLLEDRLVARGTIAAFITDFFADFTEAEGVEALVEILRKARLQDRLLEFFPQQKRTWEEFEEHFKAAGLGDFVQYNQRKRYDMHCQELRATVKELSSDDPPHPASEVLNAVKSKKAECSLEDIDVVKCVYLGLVDGVLDGAAGRNTQQTQFMVLKTLKAYHKVLLTVCTSGRLEVALLNTIQVTCYEDSRLLKLFSDIVKVLYDVDVVGEDSIRHWHSKGSNLKGRNVFLKDLEPMVKWFDEAEEEEEED